jgi:hypothetical protein
VVKEINNYYSSAESYSESEDEFIDGINCKIKKYL